MKAYQIKNNYRYVIYENEDTEEYYLVDAYEHRWITIFFPFLVWYLHYKAYPLTKEEFLGFEITTKKETNPMGVAGISLIISPMIISVFDNSVYIPNIINNARLFHMLITIFLVLLCLYIYMKFNFIDFDDSRKYFYVTIKPILLWRYILGHLMYLPLLLFPFFVFYLPYESTEYDFLLNISYLSISTIGIFMFIYMSHAYMENNGPYDYKFKNKEEI